jgi:hypothetical protein
MDVFLIWDEDCGLCRGVIGGAHEKDATGRSREGSDEELSTSIFSSSSITREDDALGIEGSSDLGGVTVVDRVENAVLAFFLMGVYIADLYVPAPSSSSVVPVKATLRLVGVDCSLGMRIEDCRFNNSFFGDFVDKSERRDFAGDGVGIGNLEDPASLFCFCILCRC